MADILRLDRRTQKENGGETRTVNINIKSLSMRSQLNSSFVWLQGIQFKMFAENASDFLYVIRAFEEINMINFIFIAMCCRKEHSWGFFIRIKLRLNVQNFL